MLDTTIAKAIQMMITEVEKETGEKFVLDDRELVGVFNDAVVMVRMDEEDGELKIRVVAGEPMKFDHSLNLI